MVPIVNHPSVKDRHHDPDLCNLNRINFEDIVREDGQIRQLSDLELLRAVLRAIETATTPEDLRRTWAR